MIKMKQFTTAFVLIYLFKVVGSASINSTFIDPEQLGTLLTCQNGTWAPSNETIAKLARCEEKHSDEEGQDHPDCIFFCKSGSLGLLNEDGLLTREILEEFSQVAFAENHKDMVSTWFKSCYDKFGSKIDKADPECKMAKLFDDCNWEVQPKLDCPQEEIDDSGEADTQI